MIELFIPFLIASALSILSKRLSYILTALGCVIAMFAVKFDPVSRYFALISFLIGAAICVYSVRYDEHDRMVSFSIPLILASVLLVLISKDCVSFLIGWEGMTLATFLAMSVTGYRKPAYTMLAFGELSAILILLGFSVGIAEFGTVDFTAWRGLPILLCILGFMVKMEIFPFHIWAPPSYDRAPANVAAVLGSILTLMGVYGIVRFTEIYRPPMPFALLMLFLGCVTAVVGALHAVTCEGMKELPAYSTIEHDGIILTLLGAYAISNNPILSAFALFSALFYSFAHSTAKSLLIMSVGDRRRFSEVGRLSFLGVLSGYVSALSLSAIPPFPGFTAEWMALETLFQSFQLPETGLRIVVVLVGAVIALAAGVSAVSMSKMIAYGFQRQERRRVGVDDLGSLVLVVAIVLLGILPQLVVPLVDPIVRVTGVSAESFVGGALAIPKGFLLISGKGFGCLSPTFVFVFVTSLSALVYALTRRRVRFTEPWAGGVESEEYDSLAYSMIIRIVLRWFYRTKELACDVIWGDVVEAFYVNVSKACVAAAEVFRRNVMNGKVGFYVLYILIALFVTLAVVR